MRKPCFHGSSKMRAKGFPKTSESRDGCIKTQKRPEKKGEKMRVISYWKATRVIKHHGFPHAIINADTKTL